MKVDYAPFGKQQFPTGDTHVLRLSAGWELISLDELPVGGKVDPPTRPVIPKVAEDDDGRWELVSLDAVGDGGGA